MEVSTDTSQEGSKRVVLIVGFVFIIILLLAGLGVGLFFLLRPTNIEDEEDVPSDECPITTFDGCSQITINGVKYFIYPFQNRLIAHYYIEFNRTEYLQFRGVNSSPALFVDPLARWTYANNRLTSGQYIISLASIPSVSVVNYAIITMFNEDDPLLQEIMFDGQNFFFTALFSQGYAIQLFLDPYNDQTIIGTRRPLSFIANTSLPVSDIPFDVLPD